MSTIAVVVVACSTDGVTTPPTPTVSQLQVVSGTTQTGKPGAVLAESLVVRAMTAGGKPVSGVKVTWTANTGGGTISPASSSTDSSGRAAAQWTLGQGSSDTAIAKVGSVTASFTARVIAPPVISQLQIVSGNAQASKPGAVLAESLVVRAVTSTGAPVSGDTITWTANASEGTLSLAKSITDATGRAAVQWTLGAGSADTATAKTGAITASFTARAVTSSSPITWTVETSGTTHNINAVWGSSGANVYAVGDSGTFLHYDGSSWSQVQDSLVASLFTTESYAIWGSSATNIYVGSGGGPLIHYDGQSWSRVTSKTVGFSPIVFGVWGDSPNDVWVANNSGGENVDHYDGSQWSYAVIPPLSQGSHQQWCPDSWLTAGLSPTYVFNYDFCGALYSFDGTTWTIYYGNGVTTYPWGISAMMAVPGNAIYAIGGTPAQGIPRGVYVASSPTSWSLVPGSPTLPQTNVGTPLIGAQNGLWGDAANDLFAAVGDSIYHYNGSGWTSQGDPSWRGWAMYGPSVTDIFVVGPQGFILHGRR